ncbi:acetyltransferase [Trypanosoma rangeli]|uniref:histone acetyltransferase n=1 Tax=Trypanosoma rangeli TaxID=5698 RepID=A0A422P0M2_TRYRA|nr:acetyltransferase [Trypanosoma rangeli]RNF11239.1 acetyltransferase [Trypanosoma rangeli]|eukprot:RNF11239.1 acetyltransferase [Trypanosoma rangeli]
MSAPEIVALPARDGVSMKVKLRWGVREDDLPTLEGLHAAAFPVKYNDEYYKWLLSDSCLALIAFTTSKCITSLLGTAESDQSAEIEEDTENSYSDSDVNCDGPTSPYSVMVGFCIGQIAYGRRLDGVLVGSPTGYLGSFAVEKRVQRRGIGEVLLDRFLSYMLFSIPVPSHLFLDHLPPCPRSETLWGLGPTLTAVGAKLSQWWFGKERSGIKDTTETALKYTKSSDAISPTASTHGSGDQVGLGEVWLHCLASDTNLLKFYVKRGFTCVFLAKHFYFFDDVYHHGMLLVYRRDAPSTVRYDSSSTCATAPALANAVNHTSLIATGPVNGLKLRRCQAASLERPEEDDLGVVNIEIPLGTDISSLRREWNSEWRKDFMQPCKWHSLSGIAVLVLGAAALIFCVALIVTCEL